MANYKTVFLGTESSGTNEYELQCYANEQGEIYISIDNGDFVPSIICLDISTAIKLSKTIRTHINLIKD